MKNKFYYLLAVFADALFTCMFAFLVVWSQPHDYAYWSSLFDAFGHLDFLTVYIAFLLCCAFGIWAERKNRLVNGCLRCREKKESGMLKKIKVKFNV